jgi:predicted ester cyclase
MRALQATGRRFAQRQSHWYRVVDGRLTEHWATRDDLGLLHQLGAAPAPRVGGAPTGAT